MNSNLTSGKRKKRLTRNKNQTLITLTIKHCWKTTLAIPKRKKRRWKIRQSKHARFLKRIYQTSLSKLYRTLQKKPKVPSIVSSKESLPDPLLMEDGLAGADVEKENFIYDRSSTFEGRKFLLCSNAIPHWFRRNWKCPHSIYQWLFQIVAFESDKLVSKMAYTTLESLWSNVGAEPAPYLEPRAGKRDLNRHIDIASFRHVLTSYGAVKSELEDSETENAVTQMSEDWSDHITGEQHIPLEQFSSALRLFSYSVRTWHKAYRQQDIKYIVRLLLQIRLDRVGNFIARDVENAIESTLSALDKDEWKSDLREFALELVLRFPYSHLQSQITNAMKPTYERSAYLKRMFALAALKMHLYLEQCKAENETKASEETVDQSNKDDDSGSSTYLTPSTSPSEDRAEDHKPPNDDMEMKLFRQQSFLSDAMSLDDEYKSAISQLDTTSDATTNNDTPNDAATLQTPVPEPIPAFNQVPSDQEILSQVLEILKNKHVIFKSRNPELDYEDVLNQALLLAEATGANEIEMVKDKVGISLASDKSVPDGLLQLVVLNIIVELQQIGRRIGVGLGSYARTKVSPHFAPNQRFVLTILSNRPVKLYNGYGHVWHT
ncbi:hypothetical protein BJV82DRAFT_102809 [Fennellomyces sp. T-0311]|nr:hypothetical protein BJV82DRAFT_102809 [Fennellomyces sp. T-0311]